MALLGGALILGFLSEVKFTESHFLAQTIRLVFHCRIIASAYPKFLARQRMYGIDDDMAMYRLGIGVGSDHALAIGEQPRRQFLRKDLCLLRRYIVFPVAGQFEVIEFPFLILLALAVEPRRLLELLGVIFILE